MKRKELFDNLLFALDEFSKGLTSSTLEQKASLLNAKITGIILARKKFKKEDDDFEQETLSVISNISKIEL